MIVKPPARACAMAILLVAWSSFATADDVLVPAPDPDAVVDVNPAPPDTCTRFGVRSWAKRVLFDKSGSCRCVKCGWHISPPRRICWRVC